MFVGILSSSVYWLKFLLSSVRTKMEFEDFEEFEMDDMSRVPVSGPSNLFDNDPMHLEDLGSGGMPDGFGSGIGSSSMMPAAANIIQDFQPPKRDNRVMSNDENKKTIIFTCVYFCTFIILLFLIAGLSAAILGVVSDLEHDVNNLQFHVKVPVNAPPPVSNLPPTNLYNL